MAVDFCMFLIPFTPGDYLFVGHHMMTFGYMVSSLVINRGGLSCLILMVLGESTSLFQNSWLISRELRRQSNVSTPSQALPSFFTCKCCFSPLLLILRDSALLFRLLVVFSEATHYAACVVNLSSGIVFMATVRGRRKAEAIGILLAAGGSQSL